MRRSRLVLVLAVLWLAITPTSAEAWFWRWLDDLSGPQFIGGSFELRVWCGSPGGQSRKDVIDEVILRLEGSRTAYAAAAADARNDESVRKYYSRAVEAATQALKFFRSAIGDDSDRTKVDGRLIAGLEWRHVAKENAEWAERVGAGKPDDPTLRPAPGIPERSGNRLMWVGGVAGFGGSASICPFKPLDMNRTFLSVDTSFGIDTKDENRGDGNKMFTLGTSAHYVLTPWLAVGTGVGRAWFSSSPGNFQKWYLQPVIVDVRPFSMRGKPQLNSPWRHAFYVRYSNITFPQGFEAGRFGGRSEAYEAELVHAYGLYLDLEPFMRKKRRRW